MRTYGQKKLPTNKTDGEGRRKACEKLEKKRKEELRTYAAVENFISFLSSLS